MRLAPDPDTIGPSSDDLLALADAVREAARPLPPVHPEPAGAAHAGAGTTAGQATGTRALGRRGHLRVLRNTDD
jgi:hypothetical protein